MHLVVTHAFAGVVREGRPAGYARGDVITDAAEMAAVQAEYPTHVVRVARPADDGAVASAAPLEPTPETAPPAFRENACETAKE